jgi:uncharacterized membrane protein
MKTKNHNIQNIEDQKTFAFLGTFFTIIGFLIALVIRKNNKYVMYYAKHGLILFIGQVLIWAVGKIQVINFGFLDTILWIAWIILWIFCWVYSLSGEQKKIFLITELSEKIKL